MQEIEGSQMQHTLIAQKNEEPDMQETKKMCLNVFHTKYESNSKTQAPDPHIFRLQANAREPKGKARNA